MPDSLRAAVTSAASPRDVVTFFRRAALATSAVAVALGLLALTPAWPGEPTSGELLDVRWGLAAAALVLAGSVASGRSRRWWPGVLLLAGSLVALARHLAYVGDGDDGIVAVGAANLAAALALGVVVPRWLASRAARR